MLGLDNFPDSFENDFAGHWGNFARAMFESRFGMPIRFVINRDSGDVLFSRMDSGGITDDMQNWCEGLLLGYTISVAIADAQRIMSEKTKEE